MRLIVGLGNPGNKYTNTRHNIGFVVADALQKKNLPDGIIKKSDVFMNDSGSFTLSQCTKYKIQPSDLFIIHDDLDIKLGEYKIQLGHSPKDHNGTKSIDESLGTDQYWHVKMGIDNRPLDARPMGIEYVLQNFNDEERTIMDRVVKEAVSELCKKLATS